MVEELGLGKTSLVGVRVKISETSRHQSSLLGLQHIPENDGRLLRVPELHSVTMPKQRPATIAEVDNRRRKAALDLRVAERKLLAYIKKATAYEEVDPAPVLQDLLGPDGRPVEGVTTRLRSRGEAECLTPRNQRVSQVTSTTSSVTSVKMVEQKTNMMTAFENLCTVHQELVNALYSLDPSQETLEGYPEYEEQALEDYIMKYSDSTTQLEQEADEVIRVLRDVFSPLPKANQRQVVEGMTALLTSAERGFQGSDLSALTLSHDKETRRSDSTRGNLLSMDGPGDLQQDQVDVEVGDLLNLQGQRVAEVPQKEAPTPQDNSSPVLLPGSVATGTQANSQQEQLAQTQVLCNAGKVPTGDTANQLLVEQPQSSVATGTLAYRQPALPRVMSNAELIPTRTQQPSRDAAGLQVIGSETRPHVQQVPSQSNSTWEQEQAFTLMMRARTQIEETVQRLDRELTGIESFIHPLVLEDLGNLAKQAQNELQYLMTAHENRARVCLPQQRSDALQEGNNDYRWFQLRIGDLQAEIRRRRANSLPPPTVQDSRPGPRYAQLERVSLPEFDGTHENWPLFVQEWKDLQEGQGRSDAVQLRELRSKIPVTARELIAGVSPQNGGIQAAFSRLEKQYGDKEVNILQVQKRLDTLVLKKKEQHERVEELCQEVERATNLLKTLGAEDMLERDYSLVGRLVGKLPLALQNNWDKYVTTPSVIAEGSSEWMKFKCWLETRRLQALNARKRCLQQVTQKDSSASKETSVQKSNKVDADSKRCYRCNQTGHLSRFCRSPSTKVQEPLQKGVYLAKIKTMDEFKAALPKLKERVGKCPVCNGTHAYKRQTDYGEVNWPSSRLKECSAWIKLSQVDRGRRLEESKGCPKCTAWNHALDRCYIMAKVECRVLVDGNKCGAQVQHCAPMRGQKEAS